MSRMSDKFLQNFYSWWRNGHLDMDIETATETYAKLMNERIEITISFNGDGSCMMKVYDLSHNLVHSRILENLNSIEPVLSVRACLDSIKESLTMIQNDGGHPEENLLIEKLLTNLKLEEAAFNS